MKSGIRICILCIFIYSATCIVPLKSWAQVSVNFQVFYDDLSPYGTWVENSSYGYVWYPNVSAGFSPYGSDGYWVMTDAGWTWVSDYPWGWAPFHYGRWYSDPIYGPMWVPGNEWGPGWVTWRRSEGYYGWAPIEPGINISVAYSNEYNVPHERWRFVRDRDFGRRDINNYYVNSSNNVTIIQSSTVINNVREDNSRNVRYNAGPDRDEVQKRTGNKIAPVALKESDRPGENLNKGELQIYRPRVEKENSAGQKAVPAKLTDMKDLKPARQRNETQPVKANQSTKEQPKQQQPGHQQEKGQTVKSQPAMQQPNNQQNKEPKIQQDGQKTNQPQHSQPNKAQPSQHQNGQPNKEQPVQHQPANEPVNKQPMDQQNNQHKKEQPSQQQRSNQQPNQQPSHQQKDQPVKEQPSQHQPNTQPPNQQKGQQQPPQNQHNNQQPQQRPVEQQKSQPVQQQPNQQQNQQEKNQPAEQPSKQQEQPQQEHHPDKEGDQHPH